MHPPVFIVPGFTPPWARRPIRLHPLGRLRVHGAVRRARESPEAVLLFTGGPVYPRDTPYVEAREMADAARALAFPGGRIVVEEKARHTTTNLRNSGRLLLARGWAEAWVSSDPGQILYMTHPRFAFLERFRRDLGYELGSLTRQSPTLALLRPSPEVVLPGPDPDDP